MSTTDDYNFNELPATSSPGFVLFKGETDQQYYFHFYDPQNNPLLYSEGYKTEKSRNAGHRSVLKNGSIEKRYTINSDEEGYFFSMKAGNHKEIARSRYFHSFDDTDKAIRWTMDNVNRQTSDFEPFGDKEIVESDMVVEVSRSISFETKTKPLKYHFRIDLYPDGPKELMNGKIQNVLTNKKKSFKGLDQKVIVDFIYNNLDSRDKKTLGDFKAIKQKKKMPRKGASKNIKKEIDWTSENVTLELIQNESMESKKHIEMKDDFYMVIKPGKDTVNKLKKGDIIEMKVFINSIKDDFAQNWELQIPLNDAKEIRLPQTFNIPMTGLYHIKTLANSEMYDTALRGSTVVNIY